MSANPSQRPALAAEKGAALLAARLGARADRPCLKKNLIARPQVQMGETRIMVKDLDRTKYYIFPEHEWALIGLFDGTRTHAEIADEFNARNPFDRIEPSLVLDFEEMLRKMDLIETSVAERNLALLAGARAARQRAAEEKAEGRNIFFLLFKVLDPENFLNRTVKYVRWAWSPPVVVFWAIAVAWTSGVFILHWEPISTGTYELYAFLKKPFLDAVYFFFLLSFIGFFHEFGHAYAVKIYGGEVHDIGVALLYLFMPVFYCDTTDALLFENKWHRLWVNVAGIYVEGFVCAGATALWVASYPDTVVHEIAYKTMLFTGISTVFFNINPLIKIDGYHALTSLLEMPELREDAFKHLGLLFQKHVLRLKVEIPVTTRRRRRIYWIYGPLALLYLGVVMSVIGGILYNVFNKTVPDFAVPLLILTLARLFKKRLRLVTRTARLVYLDKKEYLMSRSARPGLAALAALLLLVLLVPFSRETLTAEGVLSPAARLSVEAPEDGTVEAVLARESDAVREGDVLVRMSSRSATAAAARSSEDRERSAGAARAARVGGEAGATYRDEQRAGSAAAAFESDRLRLVRLDLRSPISGRVLTPRAEDLEHRFVNAGTLLVEVGDCRELVAALPVSERQHDDLLVGAEVKGYVLQRPLSPIRGTIRHLAPATAGLPRTATSETAPPLPGETPDRFVALAFFPNPDGSLRPGSPVRAKIEGPRRSYGARAWRVVSRWFRTVFW